MKPWTLVIIGVALVGAAAHAFAAPFPGTGDNPYLDLISWQAGNRRIRVGVLVLSFLGSSVVASLLFVLPARGGRFRDRGPDGGSRAPPDLPS